MTENIFKFCMNVNYFEYILDHISKGRMQSIALSDDLN